MRFAVFGLPRSGTTWAANWLTDAGALCLHDPIADHAPAELLRLDLGRPWGVSCTGLWVFEEVARQVAGRCPVVVLERDPAASDAALCRLGMSALPGWLHDRFKRAPGVRMPFDVLWREEGARLIWSILRPDAPFDVRRWRMLRDIRVEPILDRMTVCSGTVAALRQEFQREGVRCGLSSNGELEREDQDGRRSPGESASSRCLQDEGSGAGKGNGTEAEGLQAR